MAKSGPTNNKETDAAIWQIAKILDDYDKKPIFGAPKGQGDVFKRKLLKHFSEWRYHYLNVPSKNDVGNYVNIYIAQYFDHIGYSDVSEAIQGWGIKKEHKRRNKDHKEREEGPRTREGSKRAQESSDKEIIEQLRRQIALLEIQNKQQLQQLQRLEQLEQLEQSQRSGPPGGPPMAYLPQSKFAGRPAQNLDDSGDELDLEEVDIHGDEAEARHDYCPSLKLCFGSFRRRTI